MYQKDETLGEKIRTELVVQGLENPMIIHSGLNDANKASITHHFREIMTQMGLNAADPNIVGTPNRVAKMYLNELCYGLDYRNFPRCTTTPNKTDAPKANNQKVYDEMVCEKGITVHSLCEHHFVPFLGKAFVAYIPNTKLLGLSKLNRIVDFFSRRPQVQERLTAQIYAALSFILDIQDVAVVIEAEHLCVKLRGIQHQGCSTVTSKLGGRFMENPALRNEFLALSKAR